MKLIRQTYKMATPRERRVVLDNVAALSALQFITYILPIVIIPYLFRILGPDKFGLIAFAQAFIQYFIILTNYGFNISATKEISLAHSDRGKISRTFSSVMVAKMSLALTSLVLLGVLIYTVPKFRNDSLVYVFSFGSVLGSALFPVWFFQGTEKMNYITNLNMVGGIICGVLIFVFVRTEEAYLLVPLIYSGTSVLTGLWAQVLVRIKFKISFKAGELRPIQEQFKKGWDVFISVAAINAYTTTRIFLLGLLTNNNITGFYSIAERIAGACQTFPLDSFSQAIFPRLSSIFHKNQRKAYLLMRRIQRITVIIALMTLPVIIIFAEPIVGFVCGGIYAETVLTLRLLIIAVFFVSANAFRVQFLLVSGKTRIYSRIHVSMAILGLPLIFFLIDSFSYVGAAVATIAVELGVFIITFLTVRNLRFTK